MPLSSGARRALDAYLGARRRATAALETAIIRGRSCAPEDVNALAYYLREESTSWRRLCAWTGAAEAERFVADLDAESFVEEPVRA